MSELFDKILQETPGDTKRFVARSMDVSDQIVDILKRKRITQRQLAEKLGKKESEISKWLAGNHNFTLRTLAKIEDVVGEDILFAPMYWEEYKGMYSSENVESNLTSPRKPEAVVFKMGVSMKTNTCSKSFWQIDSEGAGEHRKPKLCVA